MVGKIIVLFMCIILMISISISFLGIIIDLTNKITFDSICAQALKRADLNGGLSQQYKDELKEKLEESYFFDINVIANEKVQYKNFIKLEVTSSKNSYSRIGIFKFKEGRKTFAFKKEIVSRKIHNNAE